MFGVFGVEHMENNIVNLNIKQIAAIQFGNFVGISVTVFSVHLQKLKIQQLDRQNFACDDSVADSLNGISRPKLQLFYKSKLMIFLCHLKILPGKRDGKSCKRFKMVIIDFGNHLRRWNI